MRKIKLMALLLATLMIVSAFAGCAGVKKEELDALDVRVQALEDLLNGQQKDLEDIKNSVQAGDDYSEVLEAIESIKTDLEDKIKDVNDRVDTEVGKVDTTGSVSDETKAAQQKALALIEVRRAEFNKAAGDYSEEDYVKISEALGTATGAVNAATTTDAVNAAMAALDAELDKYMSYAMKAYDYYTQLLGGINADAEELVDEAKEFLKAVKAVYDAGEVEFEGKLNNSSVTKVEEYVAELAYLVSEGNTAAKDSYIDVYNAIADLCTLYSAKTGTKEIPYEEDGKVKTEVLETLAAYTKRADSIVEEIEDTIGDKLVYNTAAYTSFKSVYTKYEQYVEDVVLLGGDALVALITNAEELVAAEDTYKNIEEAVAAYSDATRVGAGNYQDVFYYYTELVANKKEALLEWEKSAKETIWVADYYEKVDDIFSAWVAEYELSDENVEAIIAVKESSTSFYDTYIADKHTNNLLAAAVNEFKTIASKIAELNDADGASIDMVLAYDEIEELFADFVVLQEATTDKKVEAPYKDEIKLDNVDNFYVIVREADLFDDYADERLDAAFAGKTMADFEKTNGLIDLFTFEADIDELEDKEDEATATTVTKYYYYEDVNNNNKVQNYTYVDDKGTTDTTDDVTVTVLEDGRNKGEIYIFLTDTYEAIKVVAKAINNKIEEYVDEINAFSADTNMKLALLSGEYKILENAETYVSGELSVNATNSTKYSWYVDIDAIDWNVSGKTNNEALEDYLDSLNVTTKVSGEYKVNEATLSIRAFENKYPEFVDMLDLDEYNEAVATMETRMTSLFDLAEQIVEDVDTIDYVRTGSNTVYYEDENGNSKYDAGVDTILTHTPKYLVSLEDKADVDVAFATYTKWSEEGGTLKQSKIANYVDAKDNVYEDVYFEDKLETSLQIKISDASKKLHELVEDVEELAKLAKKFINTVTHIKAIDANNQIVVNTSTNHLGAVPTLSDTNASSVRKYYAWSKFSDRGTGYNSIDGTYTYVLKSSTDGVWTTAKSTDGKEDSSAKDIVTKIASTAETKKDIVGYAVTYYNDFYGAHVEYIPDASNNYEDTNKDYYQVSDYVAYDAFDKAVADFEQYNILNVKGYLFGVLDANANIYQKKLIDLINSATTLTKIENHLKTYIDDGNLGIVIEIEDTNNDGESLNDASIYDFDRLS